MKDENQLDKVTRKSNRQRVPNSFYTEGINQLKRAPRPTRQPQSKQSRKRSIVYQQDGENSEEDAMQEQKSQQIRQINDWHPCKLPKNGQIMKVQFVLTQPEQSVIQKKKQQQVKQVKKSDNSFDLLSLFQKAIENVNDEVIAQKQVDSELIVKQVKIKKQFSFSKQKRLDDIQGKILSIDIKQDRMIINQSKIGINEIPFSININNQMDIQQQILKNHINQFKNRLEISNIISQISIFN